MMAQDGAVEASSILVSQEDMLRAQLYRLIARFLSNPPAQSDLDTVSQLAGDDSSLGEAIGTFSHLAKRTTVEQAGDEFHDLFIGVGRGELLPYGSYYLSGFLHEKPLAKLRNDLAALGIEGAPGMTEPEDHISSVLESMAGMIDGSLGEPLALDAQKEFYTKHVRSWVPYFFRDLEQAQSSVLFAALGSVGRVFLEIEDTAFSMV